MSIVATSVQCVAAMTPDDRCCRALGAQVATTSAARGELGPGAVGAPGDVSRALATQATAKSELLRRRHDGWRRMVVLGAVMIVGCVSGGVDFSPFFRGIFVVVL